MAHPNRAALIAKTHKILKQHYTSVEPDSTRMLMEHLLYACCLENTSFEVADKVFGHLKAAYIDWNEVRVSSVTELSESMRQVADPVGAASRLKRLLQTTFESIYSFDLEPLKKKNLGESQKKLDKTEGTTPFIVGYAVQAGLGGHHIPLDSGALGVLHVLGIAAEAEVKSANVAGLERAIPKNKGIEFGSLLHQIGAEFRANPFGVELRKILLSINPDCKDRFPKKSVKKDEPPPKAPAKAETAGKQTDGKQPTGGKHPAESKVAHEVKKSAADKATPAATSAADKKAAEKAAKLEKSVAAEKKPPTVEKKLPPRGKKSADVAKKSASQRSKPKPKSSNGTVKKKSASNQLAKRKPR